MLLLKILLNIRALINGFIAAAITLVIFCAEQWIKCDAIQCIGNGEWLANLGVPKAEVMSHALGATGTFVGNAIAQVGGDTSTAPWQTRPAIIAFLVASIVALVVSSLIAAKGVKIKEMAGSLVGGAVATIVGAIILGCLIAFAGLSVSWSLIIALFLGVILSVFAFGSIAK